MHHLLDSIAVVGVADFESEAMDVCAEVKSDYDAPSRRLTVALDSFLRHPDPAKVKQRVRAPWLPPAETVRETVSPEEASDMARDIARSWRKNIFERIPNRAFH
jgi:hypothetical protein